MYITNESSFLLHFVKMLVNHPVPLVILKTAPTGCLRWGKHPYNVGLALSKATLAATWLNNKNPYINQLRICFEISPLGPLFLIFTSSEHFLATRVSVQIEGSTHVQVSGRWYYLMWAVSTATPSTLTPSSEMMHCVAWPFYHLLRNWVGSSLQSGDEHSKERNMEERRTISLFGPSTVSCFYFSCTFHR